jgi:predicted metal-dependent hydrolase
VRAPEYLEGVRLFNEGRYWDSHEAWETVWRARPKGSPEHRFYQGLIQLAAGFLHRERGRAAAALRCYRSGMAKLEGLPDVFLGLDLAALRRTAAECFEPLAEGADPRSLPPAPTLDLRS